ncbi:MAG: type II toxin-antitoxin system VapC family toxin [Anaerolineales bacterium]|nr:type II toxin-antitoxin system VapC family toxin [Anaerolineales bacterium]
MIVVDTNLIAGLFLSSALSEQAENVFSTDSDWVTPLIWRSEFQSVLGFFLRENLISLEAASQIMSEAAQFLQGKEYEVNAFRVLELLSCSNCSAYDCEFVSLSHDLGIRLVTNNQRILEQFPRTTISVERFLFR